MPFFVAIAVVLNDLARIAFSALRIRRAIRPRFPEQRASREGSGRHLVLRGRRMLATTVRLSEKTVKAIEDASKQRGFASTSAFIRYAVEQELVGRRDELTGTEERLVGSIE